MTDLHGLDSLGTVSRETLEKLKLLESLILKWNPAINLVSRGSLPHVWDRHIVDSAQLFPMRPDLSSHWVDLGSGGGFPGLVIAILANGQSPDLRVSLIESDQRKASFLREASRLLEIPARILCDRIEHIPPMGADVISARALAPLSALCEMAHRHLKPEGVALFMKGRGHVAELADARAHWQFDCEITPSKTDADAAILRLSLLRKAD